MWDISCIINLMTLVTTLNWKYCLLVNLTWKQNHFGWWEWRVKMIQLNWILNNWTESRLVLNITIIFCCDTWILVWKKYVTYLQGKEHIKYFDMVKREIRLCCFCYAHKYLIEVTIIICICVSCTHYLFCIKYLGYISFEQSKVTWIY